MVGIEGDFEYDIQNLVCPNTIFKTWSARIRYTNLGLPEYDIQNLVCPNTIYKTWSARIKSENMKTYQYLVLQT